MRLFLLLLTAAIVGCHETQLPDGARLNRSSPASVLRRVTDDLGSEVDVTIPARRIVSLTPSTTEMLFAIGAGDSIVGVTSFCDFPAEATTKPQVGGLMPESISIETIVALQPDLILSATTLQGTLVESLRKLSLPVLAIGPATFEEVAARIRLLGEITGHADEARDVADRMTARIEQVAVVAELIPPAERVTVFYELWHDPLATAGSDSFIGQAIELAGGRNVFGDLAEPYLPVSHEVLLDRNPQVILAPSEHEAALTVSQLLARPGWDQIDAVQHNRVHLIDADPISRYGPRLADAIEQIAAALYPDHFASPVANEANR